MTNASRPRDELDREFNRLMDAAYVKSACSHGQSLYHVDLELLTISELTTAAVIKRRFVSLDAETTSAWLTMVGFIAARCRPCVPRTLN